MPIHFNDRDVVSEVSGLNSALIVPCNMCPAVTVAVREKKPFMQLFRSLLKSAPFEEYLKTLQSRLSEKGVRADVFRSGMNAELQFKFPADISFANCTTVPISGEREDEDGRLAD